MISSLHSPFSNTRNFDKDKWQLFHVAEDLAQFYDLVDKYPEKVKGLVTVYFEETKKVLPIDDRCTMQQLLILQPTAEPQKNRHIYYPGPAEIPERAAANQNNTNRGAEQSTIGFLPHKHD